MSGLVQPIHLDNSLLCILFIVFWGFFLINLQIPNLGERVGRGKGLGKQTIFAGIREITFCERRVQCGTQNLNKQNIVDRCDVKRKGTYPYVVVFSPVRGPRQLARNIHDPRRYVFTFIH